MRRWYIFFQNSFALVNVEIYQLNKYRKIRRASSTVSGWLTIQPLYWFNYNVVPLVFCFYGQRAIPHTNLNIMVDRKEIEKVNMTKFLGVTLDCNLSWNDHVASNTQKLLNMFLSHER